MSVLSRPLYAGGRVRIVPGSVKNSVSGGGRGGGGRVGYGILGGASCRPSGRSVEARGTSKGYRSGGISSRARTAPGARSPHQEGSGPLGVPGAPARPAHPREKLATLLWGDMQDAQARGNLRHALSRIRKLLPPSARSGLVFDGPSVALDPSIVEVDVARFERLVADGRPAALEQVAGLYRGDLLAGLTLAERPFEEWLTSERERLHELAIQALGRLLAR